MREEKTAAPSRLVIVCAVIVVLCVLLLVGREIAQKRQSAGPPIPESGTLSTDLHPDDVSDYLFSSAYAYAKKWESYLRSYDPDGSKLESAMGSEEIGQGYTLYRVYTSEMAGALDELCAEAGLVLNSSMSFFYSAPELYATAGTGEFLPGGSDCVGYLYDSGSFHLDGSFRGVNYRMDLQKKSSFFETVLLTPTHEEEQWVYISHGKPLLLSLGRERCLIHTALPRSYLTLSVPVGAADGDGNGISGVFLENLADSIYWDRIEG